MPKQKFIFIEGGEAPSIEKLNNTLIDGWHVKSVTPQHVATTNGEGYIPCNLFGGFLVLLENKDHKLKI